VTPKRVTRKGCDAEKDMMQAEKDMMQAEKDMMQAEASFIFTCG